ncbi:EF-P lysine aminoacylase EpmA [Tamilnaduibacter salinus]
MPTASRETIRSRAEQLAYLRGFFARRHVLEVETPVLGRHGASDPHLDSVAAMLSPANGIAGGQGWLQTSPEYHMKRLLARDGESIFQVFRAFRDGERGRRHNPEFSLLEWYRPGFDDHALMTEVGELVCQWLERNPPARVRYRDAFLEAAQLDPFRATDDSLREAAGRALDDAVLAGSLARDDCLDVLMSHVVEPALAGEGAVFVHDYPPSQAALARVSRVGSEPVAHRFELFVDGLELCNGYWELTDAAEQAERFDADNRQRRALAKTDMPADPELLAAMSSGLPDCAGVALGLDRLLMLKLGLPSIEQVLTFPAERA